MHHQLALIRQAAIFLVFSCLITISQSKVVASPSSMAVNATDTIQLTITNYSSSGRGSTSIQIKIPIEFYFVNSSSTSTPTNFNSSYTKISFTTSSSSTNINLTLIAPSFTNDNLTFIVNAGSSIDTFIIPVYLNPTLPKPMSCNITKSTDTTLLIHDFTTTCSIGSLGINPNNYIGIIIPPYVSPITSNNGTVTLTINNNITYTGGETIKCYNQTNSSIFGDLNGYCILYVMYNNSAPSLSQNDTLKLVVSNYFRSYPSTQTILYQVGIFSNTNDLYVRQLSDFIPIIFSTPNSNAITITTLSNDCNGTEICNYLLNVSFNNPYNINQSILAFIDVINLTITSTNGGGIFLNSTKVALDGVNALSNVYSQDNMVVNVSNEIVNKSNNWFEMKISNFRNKIGQNTLVKISILSSYNNTLYGVVLGQKSLPNNTCDASCKTCSVLASNCTSCSGSFLSNNSCISQCFQGFFANNTAFSCDPCSISCKTCSVLASNCTSCSGSFLSNNSCISQCPQGFFANNTAFSCDPCSISCKTCSVLASNCTSCSGSFLSNNSCISQCPQGFFANNTAFSCDPCSISCKTCSVLASNCTSCSGSFLSNNSCISQCPQGFFANNTAFSCDPCSISCKTCSVLASNCTSCSGSFLSNNSCISQCPQGFFANNTAFSCDPCSISCKTCSVLASNCTSCSGSFLSNNSCISQCPQGFFANNTAFSCDPCSISCKTCSVLASNCTSCSGSFLSNNSCISQCPQGFFANNTAFSCDPCSISCKTCSVLASNCTSCSGSFLSNNSCISQCPQGFFANNTAFSCDPCSISCKTCSVLASNCTSCSGSFLSNNSCISQCPQGFFANNTAFSCDPCSISCKTCSVLASNCTSCSGSFLSNNSCISQCPQGFFANNTAFSCDPCSISCKTCSVLASNCTSCSGSFLSNNSCISQCPQGFFANNTAFSCDPCSISCKTCSVLASNCTSCSGSFLSNNSCISQCPQGFFANNTAFSCDPCSISCKTCSVLASNCTSCSGSFLSNNSCISQCPQGFFANNTAFSCDPCSISCKTCSGLSTSCTSCLNSFLSNSACVSQCPSSHFANLTSFTCDPCDKSCNTCVNSSTNCLSCSLFYNTSSSFPSPCLPLQNCSNQTVYQSGSCTCSNECLTCSISISNCTSCTPSLYFHLNTCLSNCPNGFFPNSVNRSCSKCSTLCSTCTATSCLTCISSDYFIFNGTCISSCPSSYFTIIVANVSTCNPCSQGCKICTNGTYCDVCNSPLYFEKNLTQKLCVATCSQNFFLFSDTCFNQCPSGYVVSNGKCVQNSSTSSSSSILLPLPLALAFTGLLLLCFLSKFRVSQTILGATTCAFSGILQNFSWILLLIFSFLTINSKELSSTLAVYILFLAILVNLALNVINLYLLKKYIWEDEKFARHLQRMKGTKLGKLSFYLIIFASLAFSHKFSEILFSNLFRHTFFVFKVKSVLKFSPLNYVKYFSLLPSLVGIAAGALLFLQFRSTQNSLYWQSIDAMIMSAISSICSIWVTRRRADFYQNNLNEKSLDLADFNFPNDPPAQVHFQMLRKEENSDHLSNKSGVRNYKVQVNTTQENLKSIEERPYFQQIHRVANQKDDIDNSLHNTRLTVNNTSRRRRVGNHEQTYEGMVPIRTNKRNAEQSNQQKKSRNKTYQDIQEEETLQDKIEKSFTYFEISALKIIRKTEAVIAQMEKEIKTQLRDSQHRINMNSDNDEMYSLIVDITESELNLLQKETRDLVLAIRKAILRLQEANITPRQFMEYINQMDGRNAENQKENRQGSRSPIPYKMPPLPNSRNSRGSKDSKDSKKGKRRNIKQSRSIQNRLIINSNFQSPFVQEFAQSPIVGKSPAFQQSQIEQFQQMPSNVRKFPNTQHFNRNKKTVQSVYKTPDSEYQQEIKQSQNDDEIDSYVRPYRQAAPTISRGYSGPLTPGKKKFDAPIMREATVDYVESDSRGINHEDIQVSKGLNSHKQREMNQSRQENIDNSPRNPMISLSRLQNINKIDSIYYTDNRQEQFQNGESIAQVMDKYSKNGEKQKEYDDVPDEHQQQFKRIRRRGARVNHRIAPNASQK